MIRLGIFVCFVSALYVMGQKEQAAATSPRPVGVPMTLTLDGTLIGAPERGGAEWQSGIALRDVAAAPAGFARDTAALTGPIRVSAPAN